jgi:tRNA threonylcarbamoyladenosine biosynthesis protein TsaB
MAALLAVETSTDACSAALLAGGEMRWRETDEPRAHARALLPMVEQLLAEASLTAGQLDAIAFGAGPGSFTGVRIGCGVAQGLAFAADVPMVRLSSLATVAARWGGEAASAAATAGDGAAAEAAAATPVTARLVVAQDARMGQVYWGVWDAAAGGALTPVVADRADAPQDALALLAQQQATAHPVVLLGRGAAAHPELVRRLGASHPWLPRARDALPLAEVLVRRGEVLPPERALPVYFRPPV